MLKGCNVSSVIQFVVNCNIESYYGSFLSKRYAKILEDLKKDPASHGNPLDILVYSSKVKNNKKNTMFDICLISPCVFYLISPYSFGFCSSFYADFARNSLKN